MTAISSNNSYSYRPSWQPVQPPPPPPPPPQKVQPVEQKPQSQRLSLHQNDTFTAAPSTAPNSNPPLASAASQSQNFNDQSRTIQQPTTTSCGEAALATVNSANVGGLSDKQLLDTVHSNALAINNDSSLKPVDLANGVNPQEMSELLGQQGQEVTRGFGQFDSDALKESTQDGKKGLMLVDANALENTQTGAGGQKKAEGQGDLHWLTIDGVKDQKKADGSSEPVYTVRDSDSSNKVYDLSRDQMENIVNQAKDGVHHSGGGLIVKNQNGVMDQQQKDELSKKNYDQSAPQTLGDNDGIGRNRGSESIST